MAFLLNRLDRNGGDRKLPRGLSVRRGTADDEHATFDVMRRTMSAEMSWSAHAGTRNHLRSGPNVSFWIAEEAPRFGSPRVVGYARSVVRDRVWSLTEFFVLPSQHRQGLGGTLLAKCLDDGDAAGADTRLVLASHHPDADSLYIRRAGCLPQLPMMLLSGAATSLKNPDPDGSPISDDTVTGMFDSGYKSGSASDIVAHPMLNSQELIDEISALDREIVGYARPMEHALWIAEMGGSNGAARLFRRRDDTGVDRLIGYSYIGAQSSGPSLAVDPQDLPRFFYHVSQIARIRYSFSMADVTFGANPGPEQFCAVAGINGIMLTWLLSSGWQIVFQYLFMCTRPMGKFDRYVCHNPLYVL